MKEHKIFRVKDEQTLHTKKDLTKQTMLNEEMKQEIYGKLSQIYNVSRSTAEPHTISMDDIILQYPGSFSIKENRRYFIQHVFWLLIVYYVFSVFYILGITQWSQRMRNFLLNNTMFYWISCLSYLVSLYLTTFIAHHRNSILIHFTSLITCLSLSNILSSVALYISLEAVVVVLIMLTFTTFLLALLQFCFNINRFTDILIMFITAIFSMGVSGKMIVSITDLPPVPVVYYGTFSIIVILYMMIDIQIMMSKRLNLYLESKDYVFGTILILTDFVMVFYYGPRSFINYARQIK